MSEKITRAEIKTLEKLLDEMKRGPYEFWDDPGNQFIVAEVKGDKGRLIAALPGISPQTNEFKAIVALLNAAPKIIAAAKKTL